MTTGTNLAILYYPIAMYVLGIFPIYSIAAKRGRSTAWFAFVPILQLWLLTDLAGFSGTVFCFSCIVLLIPLIQCFFYALLWVMVALFVGKRGWVGYLTAIPVVGLLVPYYIAYGQGPVQRGQREKGD